MNIDVNKFKKSECKNLAVAQIVILILGTIAISYLIGSELKLVSADAPTPEDLGSKTEKPVPPVTPNPAAGIVLDSFLKKLVLRGSSAGAETAGGTSLVTPVAEKISTKWILKKAGNAALIYFGLKVILPQLGVGEEATNAAANAATAAYIGYHATEALGIGGGKVLGLVLGPGLVALGAFIIIFFLSFKKTQEMTVSYTCNTWDAQTGGNECIKCNEGNLPCTEYQCKSLGQGCYIENKGTKNELCAWKDPKDVTPPIIQSLQEALISNDYKYTPDNAISPPDRGVFIKYKNGCIPAFTPFKFGVEIVGGGNNKNNVPEAAKCKISQNRFPYKQMELFIGENSQLDYKHIQTMSLPSPESLSSENITLENGGNFEFFVKCADSNGNENIAEFVFKYCVDEGPDNTAPVIKSSSIVDGTPIAFNESSVNIELYVNEPAECKWSSDTDKDYSSMENTMTCSNKLFEMNAQMLYKCSSDLTGLKDRQDNTFYFRCKDKPYAKEGEIRNVNNQGYKITLKGTQPLVIDSVGPIGTVKDSTDVAKITLTAMTSAGYKEGEALCSYSESCYKTEGSKANYQSFYYKTDAFTYNHSQDIDVAPGTYECSIKCVDLGGNADSKEFSYTVEIDESPPKVVRVYKDGEMLKVITDEKAQCVYSTNSCNYLLEPDGIKMKSYQEKEHFVEWNTQKTYYIKCMDNFGNSPLPNQCSIIVKGSDSYQ